ncbi:MAG: tRNA (N(6)-L-threonylcarbamoyladenosine(37)-C(2))-methylthiotransferase MtaB [Planctomycetes bacterium]|nr:tRNA (N(6)-L-threonylcarbamoyladenosine(37)-C(2))-methylthiotransferase MtaB [Planctomycetota bacterium]
MKYYIQTFGCKSNQYESAAIRELLNNAGHDEQDSAAGADIYIANTCGVTGRAGASCRNAIRRSLRENPNLRVVITGCGVDLGESFPDIGSGTPLLVPNGKKHAIADFVAALSPERSIKETGESGDVEKSEEASEAKKIELSKNSEPLSAAARAPGETPTNADADVRPTPAVPETAVAESMVAETPTDRFRLGISVFHGHTRAFLKVQDGCDNFCTYCAVPYARGVPESRPLDDILAEASRLVQNGHKEIVLTGINIGAYHHDGLRLAGLVARLARTPSLGRLRLGSVEPPYLDDELVRVMANEEAVCPHIHLPLQSGDDGILARMGRRYDTAEFMDKVALLQSRLDRPAITTDIIVGFPGEDAVAAQNTYDLTRRAGFSRLHVFLFSPRPGTPAAAMPQTATNADIDEWKKNLITLGTELAAHFAASCVGLRERILVEKSGTGLTDRYVTASADGVRPGEMATVRIVRADGAGLFAAVM